MAGLLRPGETLPSTRALATQLGVSRNTVGVAYDRLVAEGFLSSRVGVGTQVSETVRATGDVRRVSSPLRPRAIWADVTEPGDMSAVDAEFDFRTGVTDAREFPYAAWRALVSHQLRPSAVQSGVHIGAAGHPGPAGGDRPPCRGVEGGPRHRGGRVRHEREPAGDRPRGEGHAGTRRPGRGGGSRLPATAPRSQGTRRPRGRRTGRCRGPGRRRPARRRAARVREPVAPVPPGDADVAARADSPCSTGPSGSTP